MILRLTMPRHAHRIRVLVLIGANMAHAVQECLGNELGHMRDGMRAKDNIDVIDIGEQTLAVTLRDAAAHGDHALTRGRRREALTRVALTVQTGVSGLTTQHVMNTTMSACSGSSAMRQPYESSRPLTRSESC